MFMHNIRMMIYLYVYAMTSAFLRWGKPGRILSDQGREFCASVSLYGTVATVVIPGKIIRI